jgi:hypoxanthine phosphoribosyltransferase
MAEKDSMQLLLAREHISDRVDQLGLQIGSDYGGEPLLLIGILKGATIFLADLARAIPQDCSFDFMATASYGASETSSGDVHLLKDTDVDVRDQHVLLVEDILDTGRTLRFLRGHLAPRGPKSLKIVALLDKPSRRVERIEADYVGFIIPDVFVVGYGLDYAERFRNLPDIFALGPE